MYKFLLSNGCSFLTKRKGINNHTGVLLSDYYDCEHIDLASSGKGKDPTWDTYKRVNNYGDTMAKMLRNILELQDFFENLNIRYCMYHSLNILPYNQKVDLEKLQLFKDKINENNFYKLDEDSHQVFINSERERFTIDKEDRHPNADGHLFWCEKIKAFIEENSLI